MGKQLLTLMACVAVLVVTSGHASPAQTAGRLVLFFDDCRSSQYAALTDVERAGGHVTIACPTGLIGEDGYMTSAQIADAHSRGHEVASHSVTHPRMTDLTPQERQREWDDSQATIGRWTGERPAVWVYPSSSASATTDREALARYDRTFTGEDRPYLLHGGEGRSVGRFAWTADSHGRFLALLEQAARSGLDLVAYVHQVDGTDLEHGVTAGQLTSGLRAAARAGLRLVTASTLVGPAPHAGPLASGAG